MALLSQPPLLTPSELQKFEAPLIALANLSGGDLRKLFYAFFSFLNRRTDFYCILPDGSSGEGRQMGFCEGQAEQILLASFRQFPLRKMGQSKDTSATVEAAGGGKKMDAPKSTSSPQDEKTTDEKKTALTNEEEKTGASGLSNNDTETMNKHDAMKAKAPKNEITTPKRPKSQSSIRYTDGGVQVPVGNGGSTTRYVWTQTLEEAVVHVPVPEGTRAKDLDIEITPSSLSIRRKEVSSEPNTNFAPLSGTFFGRVKPSECTWTMESNSSSDESTTTILLTLDKVQKTWWSTILSGDPEIDNTMVDSTRHIGTYDEKTQAQIRRIMFDQRQERLGLPSSEELSGEGMRKMGGLPSGVEIIDQGTMDKAPSGKSDYIK